MHSSRGPSRLGRIVQWTLTGLLVLILAGTVFSTRYQVVQTSSPFGCGTCGITAVFIYGGNVYSIGHDSVWDSVAYIFRGDRETWQIRSGSFQLQPRLPLFDTGPPVTTIMPFWPFLLVSGVPAALLFVRRRNRFAPGCCKTCGYDLRASVRRCPECGTAIAPEPR